MADPYGLDLERRRREITAHHGVPDFVFKAVDVPKGSAQREIGDFLLWVGDALVVVSHKSRDPDAATAESLHRRRAWLDKSISKAYGQIQGVVDALKTMPPGGLTLQSERGVDVPWDPKRVRTYVGAIVLDAVEPDDDYAPPVMDAGAPTIAMLAWQWDAMAALLPSTTALISYIARRIQTVPRCPLGSELDVFALLVEKGNTGGEVVIPGTGLPKDTFTRVRRDHPDWFLGGHPDDRFAVVIDAMIEGVADPDPAFSTTGDPTEYLNITSFLDGIPLLSRVSLGKALVSRCEQTGQDRKRRSGWVPVPGGLLVFLVDPGDRPGRVDYLRGLTPARHSQLLDAGAPKGLVTLGVATEPIPSPGGRSHDFVFISGGIRSGPEWRTRRDNAFPPGEIVRALDFWRSPGSGGA